VKEQVDPYEMIQFGKGAKADDEEDEYIIDELIRKDPNYESVSLNKIEDMITNFPKKKTMMEQKFDNTVYRLLKHL